MTEFFIVANSFAAPFVSDQHTAFRLAASPQDALAEYVSDYGHPAKLFAAEVHASADAWHKGKTPLARWLSNKAAERAGDPYAGKFEVTA